MVSKNGIMMDLVNIEAIHDCSNPTFVTEIHSFIGLVGYYRHFVEGVSTISMPLTQLNLQDIPFIWSEECERSFLRLKELLTTAPILNLPVEDERFTIYCDTSGVSLGCVLMQQGWVITYALRHLKLHKHNYLNNDLELTTYVLDESYVLQYDAIDLYDCLSYIEDLAAILARDVKQLHSRAIPVVKRGSIRRTLRREKLRFRNVEHAWSAYRKICKGTLERNRNIVELLAEPQRFLHQQRREEATQYPVSQVNLGNNNEMLVEVPVNMAARTVHDVAVLLTVNVTSSLQKPPAGEKMS
ncbi:uncharacterized protein LOC129890627 [Solanum dulcamara]|uniref:uncharacterized protein LOC129890627 n=1 Tax=Solanum dulcamara TaxID=45834 RepID=UPI002484FD1A|nr:uncharacterized protein LOC129890627 [Solanum dulcamara]